MAVVIEDKYIIKDKIGEGMFGMIFLAKNKYTEEMVAIKLDESILLKNEARIYRVLADIKGISKLRSFGSIDKYNYMVIDRLGKSFEDIKVENRIDTKTIILVGLQMIRRIESVHKRNIIHRDIKPENFLIGCGEEKNLVYIIDFGLSKLFKINNKHIARESGRSIVGTLPFVSLNIHEGFTPSRRDDMESIGYTLIYLFLGGLPWVNINTNLLCEGLKSEKDKERVDSDILERETYRLKKTTNFWNIDGLSGELIIFIKYCRGLRFDEEPDYEYLKMLLTNLYKMKKYPIDNIFCWDV